ncbi:hypothetical protein [Lentzea sp.]|uniref:hypothetical protein n=1 Tax=Lentzea sp. TaxID=56099 RepID=UPI002ED53D5F
MRTVTAALVGAVCGTGWLLSLDPLGNLPCDGSGIGCALLSLLVLVPALVVVWVLVGWGLLRVARLPAAGPTAAAGTACAVVLALLGGVLLRFLGIALPDETALVVVAVAGAGGYALAAAVAAGYGGRRDRTEHRG